MRSERPRSRLLRGLPLLLGPALVSCAWILDFDGLQAGDDGKGAAGGTGNDAGESGAGSGVGGSGAVGGTAGSGGAGACPSRCVDDDPCTMDGCTAEGECTSSPVTGLALDGVDETIRADTQYRVTMAAAADAFFLSSYSVTETTPEVTFYRLDANATTDALAPIATLGGLGLTDTTEPLSAAGLAIDTARGFIHAFVGMQNSAGMERVWHVILDMNYEVRLRTVVADGYYSASPYNYPVALNLGGQIYGAWINGTQTVSVSGDAFMPVGLAAGHAVRSLALLGGDDQPFVLYTTAGDGVFLEGPGLPAIAVQECQTRPGGYLSASALSVAVPGFWLGYWTKFGDETDAEPGFLTTEGRGIVCSALGCVVEPQGDCAGDLGNAVRNPAAVTAVFPGDRTGLVHSVQVTPALGPGETPQTVSATLVVNASQIDFGAVPFETDATSTNLGTFTLATQQASAETGFRGPDWPAVAFVPPNRFAIAWTQPAPVGEELRIQRYQLCVPE